MLALLIGLQVSAQDAEWTSIKDINPFIGTGGHGHTHPSAQAGDEVSPADGSAVVDPLVGYRVAEVAEHVALSEQPIDALQARRVRRTVARPR